MSVGQVGFNGNNVKSIVITDLPRKTVYEFSAEKLKPSNVHQVAARHGEPITGYDVKDSDKKLKCLAEEGALIIVLPNTLPSGHHVELERVDDAKHHSVTVQSEGGTINGYEKAHLRPKSEDEKHSKINLTKTSKGNSNNWETV